MLTCSRRRSGFLGPMQHQLFGLPPTVSEEVPELVLSRGQLEAVAYHKNHRVSGPQAPDDSIAMGVNEQAESRHPYLSFFRSPPKQPLLQLRWSHFVGRNSGADMSGLVASQTKCFPLLHGTTVTPSGRLPSAHSRSDSLRWEGTLAEPSER